MPWTSIGSPNVKDAVIPREELEEVRRQVALGLRETRDYVIFHLERLVDRHPSESLSRMLAETDDRFRVTQLDLGSLERIAGLAAWRQSEAVALAEEAQRRLEILQNPPNCKAAKKLVCTLYRDAGLGSLVQQLVNCFMAAYETGRTFVLASRGWRYSPKGWQEVFQPLSRTCVETSSELIGFPGRNGTQDVLFPDLGAPHIPHQPLAVPSDIASRLAKFHENPSVWWVGQFIAYLFRPQPKLKRMYERVIKELNFTNPIVGIHVRRTDKNLEASYYSLEKYMKHAENYYLDLEVASPLAPPLPRRVFLATEVPALVEEARRKFPNYEFLWHKNTAEKKFDRFNVQGLMDIMTDMYLLAHSDFVVCTFSSNVCRLVYEWMHVFRPDASFRVKSLDTSFYVMFGRRSYVSVRFPHHPDTLGEAEGYTHGEVGQKLIAGSHRQDGIRHVFVLDSNKHYIKKNLPDYKVKDILDVVNVTFPEDILRRP
ncbi:alpha-(1,6)-fucosyltransferase-like isoform X2 [Eriocheir sinensis]|nr:alpha-(1,6)-fucosyltransferase-like isoform X2 [Eriocheir sinensis]